MQPTHHLTGTEKNTEVNYVQVTLDLILMSESQMQELDFYPTDISFKQYLCCFLLNLAWPIYRCK